MTTEKANSDYNEMISKMDAKNMQLTAERNLYKNELQKVKSQNLAKKRSGN